MTYPPFASKEMCAGRTTPRRPSFAPSSPKTACRCGVPRDAEPIHGGGAIPRELTWQFALGQAHARYWLQD